MNERELGLPPQVYRLRLFGLGLGFLCFGTVFFFDVPAAAAGVNA